MAGSSPGPKVSAEGVPAPLGKDQSWLSYAFGIAGIVFVAIDLFADHQAWAGVATIVCIVLAMLTRPRGFFGRRGTG